MHILLKSRVQAVLVHWVEFLGLWHLLQNLNANQGDKIALEVDLSNISFLNDLLVSYILEVIEQHQNASLECSSMEFVFRVRVTKGGSDLSISKTWFPVQKSSRMFIVIKLVETCNAGLDFSRQYYLVNSVLCFIWPVTSC